MGLVFWDGALRGGTAVLLLLLVWNFAPRCRVSQTARLGLLLTLAGLCYLVLPILPLAYTTAWRRVLPHLFATLVAVVLAGPALAAEPFILTSTSFRDGDRLAREGAGNIAANPNCVGTNASPQLAWSNLPEGTRSLAFLMVDPEGRSGLDVTHWGANGIPVTRTAFASGEIAKPPAGFDGGKSTQGLNYHMGPCTPPGTNDHHYTFIAIATDLKPDTLPADLTREELLPRLVTHAKASSGLVGRFRHP